MKSREDDWKQKERKVFLILFDESKEFFINDSVQKSDWKYYDGHYRGRNVLTREHFEKCRRMKRFPPIFRLAIVSGTKNDAFQVRMAWTQYFIDHNYTPIVGPNMRKNIELFQPGESEEYQKIKNIPFDLIVCDENNILPHFRRIGKRKRTEKTTLKPGIHQLVLKIPEAEYQVLKETAELKGTSMSEYVLDCVRVGGEFRVDTSFLEEYSRETIRLQNLVRGLFRAYLETGEYRSSDMKLMQQICDKTMACYNGAVDEMRRLYRRLTRMKKGLLYEYKSLRGDFESEDERKIKAKK